MTKIPSYLANLPLDELKASPLASTVVQSSIATKLWQISCGCLEQSNGSKCHYRTICKLSFTNLRKKTEQDKAVIFSIKQLNILYRLYQFHRPSRQWWDGYPSLDTGPPLLVSMVPVVGHPLFLDDVFRRFYL